MSSLMQAGSSALLKHPSFLLFVLSRSFSRFSGQIAAVAVGWQIYDLTGSAFDLGMVGLVQFLPTALLVFVAGHAADRYERKRVVQICLTVEAMTALFLAWGAYTGTLTVLEIFVAMAVLGTAVAFENPAISALLPLVAPQGSLQRATAVSSGVGQLATITGPALGGLAYVVSPALALRHDGGVLPRGHDPDGRDPLDAAGRRQGCRNARRSVRRRPVRPQQSGDPGHHLARSVRGAARRRDGAIADLRARYPADRPLRPRHSARRARGRRAADDHGAGAPRHPPPRGMRMFQAVIIFGVATVVFAVSQWMWFSVLALAIMGAADTVSVVIRFSLVQLATPDEMRGRVGAVNFLFINASNQLGQFESGVTAALFGAMPAAVLGGVGTVAVALLWMKLFPTLRNVERLE